MADLEGAPLLLSDDKAEQNAAPRRASWAPRLAVALMVCVALTSATPVVFRLMATTPGASDLEAEIPNNNLPASIPPTPVPTRGRRVPNQFATEDPKNNLPASIPPTPVPTRGRRVPNQFATEDPKNNLPASIPPTPVPTRGRRVPNQFATKDPKNNLPASIPPTPVPTRGRRVPNQFATEVPPSQTLAKGDTPRPTFGCRLEEDCGDPMPTSPPEPTASPVTSAPSSQEPTVYRDLQQPRPTTTVGKKGEKLVLAKGDTPRPTFGCRLDEDCGDPMPTSPPEPTASPVTSAPSSQEPTVYRDLQQPRPTTGAGRKNNGKKAA